ncbi:uncharacterized protein LOC103374034 [Stegastes partitus]|uniref:Uncharacterized protein LOC103374034 n=1 Tax=Stegastes partitus TaxID=144197 RepID=A0A9Y4U2A9_9TELE|nr:PREDICTED: uncharacterized protein LOC103374034 [Stegastes partitus]
MLEFNWIEIFSFLFPILLLQLQEISGQDFHLIVKDDDEVMLPCLNVIKTQTECSSTTWHYTNSRESPVAELVQHGQVGKNSKADRLSVAADCSLTIKKVRLEDVGQYSCRQYGELNQHQGPETVVYLSVINIHEHQDNNMVTLTCSVLTYEGCRYTVEWLHERDKDSFTSPKRPHSSCSASLTFNTPLDKNFKKSKCKVTDNNGESFLLCSFNQQSSCEETDPPHWWVYIIVATSAVLIIAAAAGVIIRQKRTEGNSNKTQKDDSFGLSFNPAVIQPGSDTSQDTADPEGGVSYASISYTKKLNSEAKGKDDDNSEEDAVTYSTVKTMPGASTDPSNIYATVNKPNKKEKVTV